jgi:hypothetical protein
LTKLQLNEAQIRIYESRGIYKKLASVYLSTDTQKHYYLHPETITRNAANLEVTCLCFKCNAVIFDPKDAYKLPEFSVANGFDYGDFSRLPLDTIPWPLNQIEKTACAYGRPYGSIMKLKPKFAKPRSLEGHIINFVQMAKHH